MWNCLRLRYNYWKHECPRRQMLDNIRDCIKLQSYSFPSSARISATRRCAHSLVGNCDIDWWDNWLAIASTSRGNDNSSTAFYTITVSVILHSREWNSALHDQCCCSWHHHEYRSRDSCWYECVNDEFIFTQADLCRNPCSGFDGCSLVFLGSNYPFRLCESRSDLTSLRSSKS